jgi:hypothetical protein
LLVVVEISFSIIWKNKNTPARKRHNCLSVVDFFYFNKLSVVTSLGSSVNKEALDASINIPIIKKSKINRNK